MSLDIAEYLGKDHEEILLRYREVGETHDGFVKWWRVTEAEWDSRNINQKDRKEIAEFYGETENYIFELMEKWSAPPPNRMAETVCKILKNHGLKKVLSYGTGIGQDVFHFCFDGFAVDAADLPGKTFDFAKWRFRKHNLNVETIDIVDDEPLEEEYDAITCFEVLQHVIEPETLVAYFRGHLRGDGLLLITTRFRNTYSLVLQQNEKYDDESFSEYVCHQGFKLVAKNHLWGPKEGGKCLYVFMKTALPDSEG